MTSSGGTIAASFRTQAADALVLRISLLLFLLHGATSPYVEIPVRILTGLMLAVPELLRMKLLWSLLTTAMALGVAIQWYAVDNHKYLLVYWALACRLALYADQPTLYLRIAARLLIASVFLAAAGWKLAAGEYVDGRFFIATFQTDPRLQPLTATLTGESLDDIRAPVEALQRLAIGGVTGIPIQFHDSPLIVTLGRSLSWLGLVLEATVGCLHLLPGYAFYFARHLSLLAFVTFTYFLLPVSGFAFVLAVAGLALCEERDVRLRTVYLCILAIVQLTMTPWQSLLPTSW